MRCWMLAGRINHLLGLVALVALSLNACKSVDTSGLSGASSKKDEIEAPQSVEFPGDDAANTGRLDCSMEIAVLCPIGEIDACFVPGEQANGHVCIAKPQRAKAEIAVDPRFNPRSSCAMEFALLCPRGQTDACILNPNDSNGHQCVANGRQADNIPEVAAVAQQVKRVGKQVSAARPENGVSSGCAQEIAVICPRGQIDACILNPASQNGHVCVQRQQVVSKSCSMEFARLCPVGSVDSCLINPATSHTCVKAPSAGVCKVDNIIFEAGEIFPAADNCNTCSCHADGSVLCTERACVAGQNTFGSQNTAESGVANTDIGVLWPPPRCGSLGVPEISCPQGSKDGCTIGDAQFPGRTLTNYHVCRVANTVSGISCAAEIAVVCPQGQIDGCVLNPQAGRRHMCVVTPNGAF